MSRRSPAGAFFDALSYPVRLLGRGLAEDENARVRVTEDAYVLELDLPGYRPEDFEVDWNGGYLSVVAGDDAGTYEGSFHFPEIVDADAVRATYDDETGTLLVTLPVTEGSAHRPRSRPATRTAD